MGRKGYSNLEMQIAETIERKYQSYEQRDRDGMRKDTFIAMMQASLEERFEALLGILEGG